MERRAELERAIRPLVEDGDWLDLIVRLLAYTRTCLANYGESKGRRWQNVTDSYAQKAVAKVISFECQDVAWDSSGTLFQLLCATVKRLIDDDEQKLNEIVAATKWEDLVPRLIAQTAQRLGAETNRYGKGPEDYVFEAIQSLLTRRRHFPRDRVDLFTFLCNTVHSLRTHDAEKIAFEGQHVVLTDKEKNETGAPGTRDDAIAMTATAEFLKSIPNEALRKYAIMRALGAHRTAKEYAAALGVTEQMIRNYDRKLKRRRARWTSR